MEFIYLFLFRVISGIQNGGGYALRRNPVVGKWVLYTTTILLMAGSWAPLWITTRPPSVLLALLAGILCLASLTGVIGVFDGFEKRLSILPEDIHLWELFATGGVTLGWVTLGGNLFLIAAHVYPALLLHKAAVNVGSGIPFWDHRTDDATGDTFSIPLLNIKIPRASLRTRQVLAVLSIVAAAVVWWQGWSFTIYDIF